MSKFTAFIKKEFMEMLPPVIFFFIAFHILALFRALMLKGYGITAMATEGATIAALVVGKVVLLADLIPFINRFPDKPLAYNIAWKTMIYAAAALLVRYLEHLVPLWWKLKNLGDANHQLFEEIIWPHFWAIQLWLLVLFFMYCTTRELIRALGPGEAKRMFFGPIPPPRR